MNDTPSPYDAVFYPQHVYEHTHPNRLGSLGTIYGMKPVAPDCCRMLELGCGAGANLIPMAVQYPDSEFVGVDLSGATVARGMQCIAALRLSNIQLLHCDIMDVDASFGMFDYVAAHGVYSWVPPQVREKMMSIFEKHLSAQGIAYVSYNSHPFSHMRNLARDMMLFHTRDIQDAARKTAQARAIMKFLSDASRADSVYGAIMRDQFNRVSKMPDEVLFHDDLNEIAEAFLLREVIENAAQHGLQYLSDAEFSRRNIAGYPAEVRQVLERFPDSEFSTRDQYQDFIDGYGFRRTLLCRADIALTRRIDLQFIEDFLLASTMSPVNASALHDDSMMEFKTEDGTSVAVSNPILKAAYLHLGESWPVSLKFIELLQKASRSIGQEQPRSADRSDLLESLWLLIQSGEVLFRRWPVVVAGKASERPEVGKLVQYQAQAGSLVTNQLHQTVRLQDDLARAFVQLLDGTRGLKAAENDMRQLFAIDVSPEKIEESLRTIAKLGLLTR